MSMSTPSTNEIKEAYTYYRENPLIDQSDIDRQGKTAEDRMSLLAEHLTKLNPKEFRKLPEIIQISVLLQTEESEEKVRPFISRRIAGALYEKFPLGVGEMLVGWKPETALLKIRGKELSTEQLIEVFASIPNEIKSLVRSLDLSQCHSLDSLEDLDLSEFQDVQTLDLKGNMGLVSLEGIEALAGSLKTLTIDGCTFLEDLDPLEACPNLTMLYAGNCASLLSIDGLTGHQGLTRLDLSHSLNFSDFGIISTIVNLEDVNMTGIVRLKDLSQFQGLRSLKKVNVTGTGVDNFFGVEHIPDVGGRPMRPTDGKRV
jgi:hypothetical protein